MEFEEYYKIKDISDRRIREISLNPKRFIYDCIDWRDRLIALYGARGTGKTTLLLQHIKESFSNNLENALYISLDNLWFETHSLSELVDMHYKNGGTHVFIDEVHHLKDWQKIIKNLYDDYPKINFVYTGSSLLKIDYESGDLSRRQITYQLPGLSFREYLIFEGIGNYPAITLNELLDKHTAIAEKVTENTKVLKHFADYLKTGYYPFYKEVFSGYDVRLNQIINQILESDYPATEKINYGTVRKITENIRKEQL